MARRREAQSLMPGQSGRNPDARPAFPRTLPPANHGGFHHVCCDEESDHHRRVPERGCVNFEHPPEGRRATGPGRPDQGHPSPWMPKKIRPGRCLGDRQSIPRCGARCRLTSDQRCGSHHGELEMRTACSDGVRSARTGRQISGFGTEDVNQRFRPSLFSDRFGNARQAAMPNLSTRRSPVNGVCRSASALIFQPSSTRPHPSPRSEGGR